MIRELVYGNNRTLARRLQPFSQGIKSLTRNRTMARGTATKKKSVPKSTKAGLILPMAKIQTHLKKQTRSKRVSEKAPLYLTAAVEDLMQSLLVAAVQQIPGGKSRLNRGLLLKALRSNKDLAAVFAGYTSASTTPVKVAANSIVSKFVLKYRAEKAEEKKKAAEATAS